jgi:hypothetical protein
MKTDLNLDAVKEFALDIWEDLGRARLAGVAVGLSLAMLAMGVLLLRPAGTPDLQANAESAAANATAVAVTQDEISFTVPGEKPLKMSSVDLSAPRDPFESLDGMAGSDADQTLLPADEAVQEAIDTLSGPSSSGGPVSAADYDDTSSLMPIDDLANSSDPTTVQTTTTTQGEADTEPDAEPQEPASAPVTDYSYAADIQFGRVDDLKRYAQVQRLGLVPSRKLPLLMYLGVSTDHRTAVFMVDSRLSQGGEGKCVPKASLCTFLELRATPEQDEHRFRDADGNEYLLRLRRLVRTTASNGSLSGRAVSELNGTPPVVDGTR